MDILVNSYPDDSSCTAPQRRVDDEPARRWALWVLYALLALAGYTARGYPEWRAQQLAMAGSLNNGSKDTKEQNDKDTKEQDDKDTKEQNDKASFFPSSPSDAMSFSVRWIPFMPFALVYLLAKVFWSFFRWLVFNTLWSIERSAVYIPAVIEKVAVFAVQRGPDLVHRYIVLPAQCATNFVWQTVVLEWCRPPFEQVVVPTVVHTYSVVQQTTVKHYHSLAAFTARWADPVMQTMTWVVTELVYRPFMFIGSRVAVVAQTFLHTAKVYIHELAKDAADLLGLLNRAAQWLWNKVLCPLGAHLVRLGSTATLALWTAAQKFALWTYNSVLWPSWSAAVNAIKILRSHPTLLAGIQALSAKAREKAAMIWGRIEDVNWLLLIESGLTWLFTGLYKVLSQALSLAGKGIAYFFVEMVPNAYQDLQSAINFMRPIVEWVVRKVLAIIRPCWLVIVWLAQLIATNASPFLAWLNRTIWTPLVQVWQTTAQPALTKATAMTIQLAVIMVQTIRQSIPFLATVFAPVWKVVVDISDVLSRAGTGVGRVLLSMTGGLGVKVQQTLQEMTPQFVAAKEYMGHVLDDMVIWANNAMVDWVKKEKRE